MKEKNEHPLDKKGNDLNEHPFDRYSREGKETRRLCRIQWLHLQAGILTVQETKWLFNWLWSNGNVADPAGKLRCKMLHMIPMSEIDKAVEKARFVPANLEWAIEKRKKKDREMYGDIDMVVENEEDESNIENYCDEEEDDNENL